MPRQHKIRNAYSRLLHDASMLDTWSVAVSWSFTITPMKVCSRDDVQRQAETGTLNDAGHDGRDLGRNH